MKNLSQITRTEVFFTGNLYFASQQTPKPIEQLLLDKLGLSQKLNIIDAGFEVCLFRDFALAGYLDRLGSSFEKQTLDNVFVLSDQTLILVKRKPTSRLILRKLRLWRKIGLICDFH